MTDYDAIVVGGGVMGCSIALHIRRFLQRVLLLEEAPRVCGRASYANQARVHNGYHYPRSVLTGLRSRVNFPRFVEEYRDCVHSDFTAVYAIGRQHSKVSAAQFVTFCRRIGAPLEPAPAEIRRLFERRLVEDVFLAQEYVFDANKLATRLHDALLASGVELTLGGSATRVRSERGRSLAVEYCRAGNGRAGDAEPLVVRARHVIACTYSRLNELLGASGLPAIPLKHELAELALVDVPPSLRDLGITVMCGPFFSLMPFPPRALHTLSHVRYTPHSSWQDTGNVDGTPTPRPTGHPATNISRMTRDAQRFVPALAECRYVESLWEVKTVLPRNEVDDGRPILFLRDHGLPQLTCVLGAKIDNIYDVYAELDLLRHDGAFG